MMTSSKQVRLQLDSYSKIYFENISQSLFFKNAFFGFAFMIILLAFDLNIFISGLAASGVGFFYSLLYPTPKVLKQAGLMTINGLFLGIALASLFSPSPQYFLCLALGAMVLPLVTKAAYEILQHWKLSPLIGPYILILWILWLCADKMVLSPLPLELRDHSYLKSLLPDSNLYFELTRSLFYSIGQIFFLKNSDFGLCLFLLVSIFSPRRGVFLLIGTALSTLIFYFLAGNSFSWNQGFFSGSAGLVGLGLAAMPERFRSQTILLFCIFSLFVTVAIEQFFQTLSLPILSLPYVLTFWLALLSRAPRVNLEWASLEARPE